MGQSCLLIHYHVVLVNRTSAEKIIMSPPLSSICPIVNTQGLHFDDVSLFVGEYYEGITDFRLTGKKLALECCLGVGFYSSRVSRPN